jgi:hypothetical protein
MQCSIKESLPFLSRLSSAVTVTFYLQAGGSSSFTLSPNYFAGVSDDCNFQFSTAIMLWQLLCDILKAGTSAPFIHEAVVCCLQSCHLHHSFVHVGCCTLFRYACGMVHFGKITSFHYHSSSFPRMLIFTLVYTDKHTCIGKLQPKRQKHFLCYSPKFQNKPA